MYCTDRGEENVDSAYEKALTVYKPWHTEIKIRTSERQVHYSVGKAVLARQYFTQEQKIPCSGAVSCRSGLIGVAVHFVLVVLLDAQVTLGDGE